ncbi:hypothetical protein [Amaricoccus solimangrovi]|uniref:Uncharacterized protein n=1 Tax=Amaricoccus solimangrovi TaxID=2589815 RepID=A0A501WUH0_9RHOB|nr:hypothetical protein [Amaricoccus solimangrovi]TPE53068.1 hypothetical protein FJM51_03315 [Amaricoccus solimangrovi]
MTIYTKTDTMRRRGDLQVGDIINEDGVMTVIEKVELRGSSDGRKPVGFYAAINGETDPLPADFEHTIYTVA